MASMAFVLLGCSDNSAPIVAPTEQIAPANDPSLLEKANVTEKVKLTDFTAIEKQGKVLDNGIWVPDGDQLIITGMKMDATWESKNKLVRGYIVVTLNGTLNTATGAASFEGTFTLKPDGGHGGIWKGKCEGTRGPGSLTSHWTEVAHGKGGKIDGMKLIAKEAITASDPMGTSYTGVVEGYIKSDIKWH
jgi:hypothetical protein